MQEGGRLCRTERYEGWPPTHLFDAKRVATPLMRRRHMHRLASCNHAESAIRAGRGRDAYAFSGGSPLHD